MTLNYVARMLKAFLYPPKCLACGSLFQTGHHRYGTTKPQIDPEVNRKASVSFLFQQVGTKFLCPSCNTGYTPVEPPFCKVCGTMFSSCDGKNHSCGICIKKPPYFNSARAAGIYENALMALIQSLKYKKDIQVAKPLGKIMFAGLARYFSEKKIDIALPVPLHPKKFRERGFNQVYLLMRKWPEMPRSAYPAFPNFDIKKDIITRIKNTEPQTGLDEKKRKSNIKDAFYLKNPSVIAGKNILIVDDVMTTGATVNECAKTLKKGGAKEIHVLTLARTHYE